MEILKCNYYRFDDYINFMAAPFSDQFIDVGTYTRNLRYRSGSNKKILFSFTLDVSLNELVSQRDFFNLKDLLGNVGGLYTAILCVIGFLYSSIA